MLNETIIQILESSDLRKAAEAATNYLSDSQCDTTYLAIKAARNASPSILSISSSGASLSLSSDHTYEWVVDAIRELPNKPGQNAICIVENDLQADVHLLFETQEHSLCFIVRITLSSSSLEAWVMPDGTERIGEALKRRYDYYEKEQSAANLKEQVEKLAALGHELRTPLTLILGPASELREEKDQKRIEFLSQTIVEHGQKLHKIIDDVTLSASLERKSSEFTIKHPATNLRSVLNYFDGAMENLSTQIHRAFEVIVPDEDVWVAMASVHVERILFNLIQNSIKYADENKLIRILCRSSKDSVEIVVEDEGNGIAEEDKARLGEAFYRSADARKQRAQGLGLGLHIVNNLASSYEGRFSIENYNEGGRYGARATCVVPKLSRNGVYAEEENESEIDLQRAKELGFIGSNSSSRSEIKALANTDGLKTLLVEDEPVLAIYLSTALWDISEIEHACSFEEAKAKLEQELFDVIIVDLTLPDGDGLDLIRLAKERLGSEAHIVATSAHNHFDLKRQALLTGAEDFLEKPFDTESFKIKLRTWRSNQTKKRLMEHNNSSLTRTLKAVESGQAAILANEQNKLLSLISTGLLHEIRNGLNESNMSLYLIKKEASNEETSLLVDEALEAHKSILKMCSDIRSFTSLDLSYKPKRIAVNEILERAVRYLKRSSININVSIESEQNIEYRGLESMIFISVVGLLYKALTRAQKVLRTKSEAQVIVCCEKIDGSLAISVEDNGELISKTEESSLHHLLSSDDNKLIGIEYMLTRECVERHKGTLSYSNLNGEANRITMSLKDISHDH